MKYYIIDIIKVGAVTLVIAKAVKIIGKKDMSDVISLGGLAIVSTDFIKLVDFIIKNPPAWYTSISGTLTNIANAFNNLAQAGVKIETFFDKLIP